MFSNHFFSRHILKNALVSQLLPIFENLEVIGCFRYELVIKILHLLLLDYLLHTNGGFSQIL